MGGMPKFAVVEEGHPVVRLREVSKPSEGGGGSEVRELSGGRVREGLGSAAIRGRQRESLVPLAAINLFVEGRDTSKAQAASPHPPVPADLKLGPVPGCVLVGGALHGPELRLVGRYVTLEHPRELDLQGPAGETIFLACRGGICMPEGMQPGGTPP